jgi:hypothetical protein
MPNSTSKEELVHLRWEAVARRSRASPLFKSVAKVVADMNCDRRTIYDQYDVDLCVELEHAARTRTARLSTEHARRPNSELIAMVW